MELKPVLLKLRYAHHSLGDWLNRRFRAEACDSAFIRGSQSRLLLLLLQLMIPDPLFE